MQQEHNMSSCKLNKICFVEETLGYFGCSRIICLAPTTVFAYKYATFSATCCATEPDCSAHYDAFMQMHRAQHADELLTVA